jgi:hypothetical protein
MDLVKVKRGSKRLKKIVIVTPKQFKCLSDSSRRAQIAQAAAEGMKVYE